MLIKICGITRAEDALAAVDAGATALGFNFWRPGKRYIAPERAAEIASVVPMGIRKVGVFVDENPATVLEIAARVGLDVLQFHGAEPPEYLHAFETLHAKWKAIRVAAEWNPATLAAFTGVEAFLLDSAGATPGGTGQTFDWPLAVGAKHWGRVVLGGGLTPANLNGGVGAVAPCGLDVATGVEVSPGFKNH